MKYITILDFSMGHVHQYEIQEDQYEIQEDQYERHEDLIDFIISKGFSLSNIEWMSHYDKTIY
jgi:hypothetical protein